MARFTTILCDLDGTLVDSHRDIAMAFQRSLRCMTDGKVPDTAAIARHIGKPLEEMAQALGYCFSPVQRAAFLEAYRHYYATQGMKHTRPYPGVTTTLQAMSTMIFGIVTTKSQEQAELVLHQLKLTRYFRHIQGWGPGLRLKPAPDSIVATLEALRCAPEQALMVGDTSADVLAGKAAGVKTCAVTYGFGSPEELLQCQPDYCIESFSALTTIV